MFHFNIKNGRSYEVDVHLTSRVSQAWLRKKPPIVAVIQYSTNEILFQFYFLTVGLSYSCFGFIKLDFVKYQNQFAE